MARATVSPLIDGDAVDVGQNQIVDGTDLIVLNGKDAYRLFRGDDTLEVRGSGDRRALGGEAAARAGDGLGAVVDDADPEGGDVGVDVAAKLLGES